MNVFETTSLFIALLALLISGITAYQTFYAKFQCEFFVKPRIILTQLANSPALVIGCEIVNSGTLSGAVDDVVLAVKYKQSSIRGVDRYTFFPKLLRNDYNVLKKYSLDDFEPFQTLAMTGKSRFAKYILFNSANSNFFPTKGEITVQLFFRVSGEKRWKGSGNLETLTIDEESLAFWNNPANAGASIMLETKSNYEDRDKLMESVFR